MCADVFGVLAIYICQFISDLESACGAAPVSQYNNALPCREQSIFSFGPTQVASYSLCSLCLLMLTVSILVL